MQRRTKTRLEILFEQDIPWISRIIYSVDNRIKRLLMGENDVRDQEYNLVLLLIKNLRTHNVHKLFKDLQRLGLKNNFNIGTVEYRKFLEELREILEEYYKSRKAIKTSKTEKMRLRLDSLQKIFVLKVLKLYNPDIFEYEKRISFLFENLYGTKEFDNYFFELSKKLKLSQNKEIYSANVIFLAYLSALLSLRDIPHTYIETFAVQIFRNVYGYVPSFNLRTKIVDKLYKRIRYDDVIQYGLVKDIEYLYANLSTEQKNIEKYKSEFTLHRSYIKLISDRQFTNVIKSGIFIVATKGFLIPILAFFHGIESVPRSIIAILIMIIIGFIVSKTVIIRFDQEQKSFNDTKGELFFKSYDFNDNEPGSLRQFLSIYKLYATLILILVMYFVMNQFNYALDEIIINIFLFSVLLNSSVNIHKTIESIVLSLKNVIRINYFILIFLGFAGINEIGNWIAKKYRDSDPVLKFYSTFFSVILIGLGKFFEHFKSCFLFFISKVQDSIHDVTRAGD